MKRSLPVLLLSLLTFAFAPPASRAQYAEKILYSFTSDGWDPSGPLILDAAGNLYGTTQLSSAGTGDVFELSPSSSGTWTQTILYASDLEPINQPQSGLIFDAQGNLYGVSYAGGSANQGTVFELSPSSSGWTLIVLYSFQGGADGAGPVGSLIFDSNGNLYGTTRWGGGGTAPQCFNNVGCGTVFELSPSSTGWTEKVLHAFSGASDGSWPGTNLLLDAAGNLYGTAMQGGSPNCDEGCGTVFRLTPSGGTWHFGRIWALQGTNGNGPGSLVFDSAGDLYGVALRGGKTTCPGGCGLVFKLTRPASSGPWKQSIVHAFAFTDGSEPSGLIFQPGNDGFFGTASAGGSNREGTVFEISPTTSGGWEFTTLYNFNRKPDGYGPEAGVIFDSQGNLYGTTGGGGTDNLGTVFELFPTSSR